MYVYIYMCVCAYDCICTSMRVRVIIHIRNILAMNRYIYICVCVYSSYIVMYAIPEYAMHAIIPQSYTHDRDGSISESWQRRCDNAYSNRFCC